MLPELSLLGDWLYLMFLCYYCNSRIVRFAFFKVIVCEKSFFFFFFFFLLFTVNNHRESILWLDNNFVFYYRRQPEKPKEEPKPAKKPSPRPMSAKYRHRPAPSELPPPPPRPTVINIPEPKTQEDVTVSNATQTSDTVGIQTEKKLLEEYDHVSFYSSHWIDSNWKRLWCWARHINSLKYWLIPRKRWLCLDINENILTGMLNLYTNKQTNKNVYDNRIWIYMVFRLLCWIWLKSVNKTILWDHIKDYKSWF